MKLTIKNGWRLALMATLGMVVVGPLRAAELHVPESFPTIQGAINAAIDGDQVVIAPGIYSGAGNTNLSFGGKDITVRGVNPADSAIVAATIIDGFGTARGFNLADNAAPVAAIRGLTIRNMVGFGSAIRIALGVTLTVADCVITGCADTAVLVTYGSAMTLERCTITGNSSAPSNFGAGGLHLSFNSMTVSQCTIADNEGGGISSHMNLTLLDSTITGNSGGSGAGLLSSGSGELHVDRCIFANNTASQYGGGIFFAHSGPTGSAVRNTLIYGNNAGGLGGGVYIAGFLDSTFLLAHTTIAANVSGEAGGGVSCSAEQAAMDHCILWNNEAPDGDNLHMGIVTNGLLVFPANLQIDYSNFPDVPGSSFLVPTAQLTLGDGVLDVDPLFVDPAAGDYHLSSTSPCIDAGNSELLPEPGETDIDGDQRVIGPVVDIGADEFQALGDLTSDGTVGPADLALLLGGWGLCSDCAADLNNDGAVGPPDLALLLGNWG